jgi:hypothetical protein
MRKEYGVMYRIKNKKYKRHINICSVCGKEFLVAQCGRQPKKCIDCLKNSENAMERWRANYRKDFSGEKPERIRL